MLPWVGDRALHGIGERQILNQKSLGLICSVQCPGSVVIKTFDAIRELRDAGVVVAGGFHSPMEQECLDFLLRGDQPVIVSPAKGLCRPRLSAAWRTDIDAGRLLLLSPFGNTVTRTTAAQAETRNEFIAALSHAVLIPHASTGGKAAAIARQILERGQPLFTFDDDENSELLKLGAQTYQIPELKALIRPAVE
jgi:predicted Rossmann fold nucleotide-binding protein DprA/Smf involved in DNA uptake